MFFKLSPALNIYIAQTTPKKLTTPLEEAFETARHAIRPFSFACAETSSFGDPEIHVATGRSRLSTNRLPHFPKIHVNQVKKR
jgi:hypothetical protein